MHPAEMSLDELQEELVVLSQSENSDDDTYRRIGHLEAELAERRDVYWAKKDIARD